MEKEDYKESKEEFMGKEIVKLREETRKCMVLNNFLGGIWAIQMLKEEDLGKTELFNFDLAEARTQMY